MLRASYFISGSKCISKFRVIIYGTTAVVTKETEPLFREGAVFECKDQLITKSDSRRHKRKLKPLISILFVSYLSTGYVGYSDNVGSNDRWYDFRLIHDWYE
jgi:hypothetical protein